MTTKPLPPGSDPEVPSDTVIDEADVEDDSDDLGSIDRLIAVTDQAWDVEAQVLTLQQAAATRPVSEQAAARPHPSGPQRSITIPTALDLAPALVPPPRRGGGNPSPASSAAKPSRRQSNRPPPLPRKAPPPAPGPVEPSPEPSPVRVSADVSHPDALVDLLQARVTTLEAAEDKVGLARAHMELAVASEVILGDDARATKHAESALKVDPSSAAAHALLRRIKHGRVALPGMLVHVEHEIAAATTEAHRVELLAVRARLLEAAGDRGGEARATWEQALKHAPNHAAALKGLEAELIARAVTSAAKAEHWEALAAHLVRMADAYATEKPLAAWLHVERARVLERQLQRVAAARGALERALEIDPSVGPVRDALVRHVAAHGDWGALARLLGEEANLEPSTARAARLELDAAMIAATRLGERESACALLERAAARAPTVPHVDRRVLDELIRLNELEARWADATRARRARIRFITDPPTIVHELRALATIAEQAGDLEEAIAEVQRALAMDTTDPTLVDTLDRLLSASGGHDARIAAWLQDAARTEDAARRARAFGRAAQICEEVGRTADAVRHLRSAWLASPGDEVLDGLARLLSPVLSEAVDVRVRSLVELYVQAAEQAKDVGRKTAYLEKVALLWEDLLGDPVRAARAYEQVLAIHADRRSAVLGLERTSARSGDARTLARALLDEARLSPGEGELSLRTRAAEALSKVDPARAMQIVREVLDRDRKHAAARALETRLEGEAGRWELAAKSLRARVDAVPTPAGKVALWLELAQVQHLRLRAPLDALASLEQARSVDPTHPVPPEEIARLLEDHGDARVLRDAIERLAARAHSPDERARHLARAAEIDELRLGDDASAMRAYQRALAEAPGDEGIAERLVRVATRRARHGHGAELAELAALLGKRLDGAASPSAALQVQFDLAVLLTETGQEPARAASLLEAVLAERHDHVPALRTLEWLRRRAGDIAPLARVLAAQGDELKDVRARLGSLWNLAALEEWRLPGSDAAATYGKILELDPTDPIALEATLRRELPHARRGDPGARKAVFGTLRALVAFASDEDTRLALQLRLALMLEAAAADSPESDATEDLSREALDRYRDALRIDELSVAAATGVARLAGKLGDPEAAVAAARSLADLAREPRMRARYLVDSAEILLASDLDARLGSPAERSSRAASILQLALEADPDSMAAAGRLAAVLLGQHQSDRLLGVFREALGRAKAPEAIVMLGSEIARVAREELQDLAMAIDAMRRVRDAAPQHVPSLLTLAELCIAQHTWPDAVDALEAVVTMGRDSSPKLTALFALASIYDKVLSRPEDVDRVLRAALALDPSSARALRGLLHRVAAQPMPADETAARARRKELAGLLGRLAEVETDRQRKSAILLELSEVHLRLGDSTAAERALVQSVATAPAHARAFARLMGLFKSARGMDALGSARALSAVIGLGQELGQVDASWYAALGQVEIHSLSRLADGIAHLQRAVALDPALYETRFELASAYVRMNAHEDASRALLAMLMPTALPMLSISDPSAGLALLEQSLSAEKRADEAVVVTELRSLAGVLEDGRRRWLASRRAPPAEAQHGAIDRSTLVRYVLPAEARHVLVEVAAAIAGIEAKILRSDLAALGISPRDRITSRSGHPTRMLLDRIARQLGVGDVELAVAPTAMRTRVLAQDEPWVVVPPSLVERPEPVQIASLARALARIAYGVPWLEELPPLHVQALLVAAARQVARTYGGGDGKLVAHYEPMIARTLSRRQRKLLEELAPQLSSQPARPPPPEDFVNALARAELRTAFLVTGDLLAIIEEMRPFDGALNRAIESPGTQGLTTVLEHPFTGDLVRFALSAEATALRRRIGSTWVR